MNRKQRRAQKNAKGKKNGAAAKSSKQTVKFQVAPPKPSADEAAKLEVARGYLEQNKLPEATRVLADLIKENPTNISAIEYMGIACDKLKNYDAALVFFEGLKKDLGVTHPKVDVYIGHMYLKKDKYEIGLPILEEALKKVPSAFGHGSLGNSYNSLGKKEEAGYHFHKAIDLDNHNPEFLYNYTVHHHKFKDEDDKYLKLLHETKDKITNYTKDNQVLVYFSLYKAYEDLKQFDTAFEYLEQGTALKRSIIPHEEIVTQQFFEATVKYFDKSFFEEFDGETNDSDKPVFILAMPRSGTTLLEQILHAHPDVEGIGEDALLSHLIRYYSYMEPRNDMPYPFRLPTEHKEYLYPHIIAKKYVDYLDKRAPGKKRVVNKAITNKFWYPYLKVAMPNAKFIHIHRHPIDCCMSCYTKNFNDDAQAYSYNQEEMGRFYKMYVDLMKHWDEVTPDSYLDVKYENIVDNFEYEARRIIEYLDLEWNDSCLKFYENESSVRTASLSQVRKPIYKSAVQRWRRYDKHLVPLIKALGPAAPEDAIEFLKEYEKTQ